MSDLLPLDSLEIDNFRAFKHLQIEQLKRVNLIVGKNNVGKTTLLEALRLYASRAWPPLILRMLEERKESLNPAGRFQDPIAQELTTYKSLFFGRDKLPRAKSVFASIGVVQPIRPPPASTEETITTTDPHAPMTISVDWFQVKQEADGRTIGINATDKPVLSDTGNIWPCLVIRKGKNVDGSWPLTGQTVQRHPVPSQPIHDINCVLIPADGLDASLLDQIWQSLSPKDERPRVLDCIRLIEPRIEMIEFADDFQTLAANGVRSRVAMAELSGMQELVPFPSIGEGMNRLLGIGLALMRAQNGLLLIDEVDTGLHYTVLPTLWRFVFEVAQKLNVQVFATTHSWDCIEAFARAVASYPEDGQLISLRTKRDREGNYKPGEIAAVLYNADDLEVATQEQIEVR